MSLVYFLMVMNFKKIRRNYQWETVMLKRSISLIILSLVFLSSAQACYKIPTKTENAELQESIFMTMNVLANDLSSEELVYWYLAFKDLMYREMVIDGVAQQLTNYYCDRVDVPECGFLPISWRVGCQLVFHRAKNKQPAQQILETLRQRFPEDVTKNFYAIEKKGYERIKNEITMDITEQYWQERVAYNLNYIITDFARFFQDLGYLIDWEALGIVDRPYEPVRIS